MSILFAVIVVFLLFFNTYIFQAGLVSILISKFKATILFVLVYLGLSIGLHVWGLVSAFFKIIVLCFLISFCNLLVAMPDAVIWLMHSLMLSTMLSLIIMV